MWFSRQAQSLVGETMDGNIQIHSLQAGRGNGPTYIAQDLSSSTFYELRVFPGRWDARSKRQPMWYEYARLKEDSRFVKEWREDRKTFILLRLRRAPLLTEEGTFILDAGKKVAVDAGRPLRKTGQRLIHANASVPDFNDVAAFPSLGDSGIHIQTAKDTRYIALDEADQKKARKRKPRVKREKGRKEKGEGEPAKIKEAKQAVEARDKTEKEMNKENAEPQHQQKESGQQERGWREYYTPHVTAEGRLIAKLAANPTAKSIAEPTPSGFDIISLLGAAEFRPAYTFKNNLVPLPDLTKWLHLGTPLRATNGWGKGTPTLVNSALRSPYGNLTTDILSKTSQPSIAPIKSTIGNGNDSQRRKANVDTSRLYSELPIYYPQEMQAAAAQETEIRLVELKPAFMGDSLFCNMYCTRLQKKSQFIALSYAWGDPDKTHTIHVRGYEMPVTKNLHQALMQLRKPQESVLIWADAICINQANLQERNYQVRQMPKIYSAAQEVVAWLGESTLWNSDAMKLITLAPEELRKKDRSSMRANLNELFSRPYWSRVWVVQELAAANRTRRACTLRCGSQSVTLDQFRSFLRSILRQMKISELKTMTRPRSLLSLSTLDPSRTFLHVLWESSSLQATDARDRIYGIRGISPKFYRDNIEVDYGIDFERLCGKVMALMVKKERSLDVLCYFHRYVSDSASPSWLRDFSKRNTGIPATMYSCDKGRKANAEIVNGILRTRGVRVGHVCEIRVFSKTTRKDNWIWKPKTNLGLTSELCAIKALAFGALEKRRPHETELARENRFLEMFAGGKQQAMERLGKEYRARWQRIWDKRIAFEQGTVSSDEWQRYDEAFFAAFARLVGRCVFTTVEGNLGLGPGDMKKGDLVCILYGCKLPAVLRKDGRYFTFVGPAYVDAAMNGEFVSESEKGDRFWIR